jgi:hypothetical protein
LFVNVKNVHVNRCPAMQQPAVILAGSIEERQTATRLTSRRIGASAWTASNGAFDPWPCGPVKSFASFE